MANTSSRTLRLLSLLQTRRYWPGEELAGQLQVSPRTLRRDIDRLRELGYPIQAQRGVAGGYQLAAGTALPPLVVDDEEAVALALGLQAAAQGAVEGIAESSVRALAKVVQVMPARLRRRVQALGAMTVPASWEGAAGRQRGSGGPHHPGPRLPGYRTDPVLLHRGVRPAHRAARQNRTASCCSAAAGTWPATTWTGRGGAATGWTGSPAPDGTGIRFRPARAARRRRRRLRPGRHPEHQDRIRHRGHRRGVRRGRCASGSAGGLRSAEISASRCRVRMTADMLEWPIMGLGLVGADFQVISPPELIDWVRDWGARFSRAADLG